MDIEIVFLVDTGADATSIHPGFAKDSVHIPYDRLGGRRSFTGVGGSSQYFSERALVSFADDGLERVYNIDLYIAEPSDANARLPSLLGRDIINNWYMQYDPSNRRLDFSVRYADRTIRLW